MQTATKHQLGQAGPMQRLNSLVAEALAQYHAEIRAGGDPVYPAWIDDVAAPASARVAVAAQRIFLVPTGEVHCGQETYTRHEGQPRVNTDNECLYAAPQASEAVRRHCGDTTAWCNLFWSVAKELNCPPSSFVDGNEHVMRAAQQAHAALTAQTGGGGHA